MNTPPAGITLLHVREVGTVSHYRLQTVRQHRMTQFAWRIGHGFQQSPSQRLAVPTLVSARHAAIGSVASERSEPASSAGKNRQRSQRDRIRASHERNAVEPDIPILRNEMRSLRHGLRYEEMIEGITVISQWETALRRTSFSASPIRRHAWFSASCHSATTTKHAYRSSSLTLRLAWTSERPPAGCRSLRQL